MNFFEMIKDLEDNKIKARRADWGYAENSYIILLENNQGVKNFFITNTMRCLEENDDKIIYGITYEDTKSLLWETTQAL